MPGMRLGRHVVVDRIASGGMAELYLARQHGLEGFEKTVALKRVLPHLAEDPEFIDMFLNEARLCIALDHPNIAQVFEVGFDGGEHYFALEYVHGKNLHEILRAQPPTLPLAAALLIVCRVAAGLHYAHGHKDAEGRPLGIVHRDVTPSNVMIGYSGTVKLTDFGIARVAERTSTTRAGTIKGKASYMSPEQWRGDRLDRRSDVFSLGALLYQVTTGMRAFRGPNDYAILAKVARADYAAPSTIVPEYPPELAKILERALQVEPADRYESAQAFQLAIEEFAVDAGLHLSEAELALHMERVFGSPPMPSVSSVSAAGGSPVVMPASRARSGSRWKSIASGGLLTIVGIGVGAVAFGGDRTSGQQAAPEEPRAQSDSAASVGVAPPAREVPTTPDAVEEPRPTAPETANVATVPAPEPAPTEPEVEPAPERVPRKRPKKKRPKPPPSKDEGDKKSADAMFPRGYE